jgi:hypothetical protein
MSLADAELDHRVALADARDAYREAVQRARAQLVAATARADRVLAMAHAQQRSDELHVAGMAAYYRARPQVLLEEDLARFQYTKDPGYAVYRDRREDAQIQQHIDLISAEIARRAAIVS